MTANRKADLQRKLTLAPVAKPPAGLAERIKREIPKDLRFNAETERQRLSKAVAFNLRVAASILILVSSAYLGLRFLSQIDEKQQIPTSTIVRPRVLTQPVAVAKGEAQVPAAPPVVPQKQAAKRGRRPDTTAVASAPPPAAAPLPPPAAPSVAESINVPAASRSANGIMAMDRIEKKAAIEEITTSPVSGKEMRYSAKDKIAQVVTSKLQDEKITPWASVSPAAKRKILEAELAAGADKKLIARVAREAGLIEFADSIEKR